MGKCIFFCSRKEKRVSIFLRKSKISPNSVRKSILTVEALWYGLIFGISKIFGSEGVWTARVFYSIWSGVPL